MVFMVKLAPSALANNTDSLTPTNTNVYTHTHPHTRSRSPQVPPFNLLRDTVSSIVS